jgi:hypothetical protein
VLGLVAVVVVLAGWSTHATAQPANDDCAAPTVVGALPFSGALGTTSITTAGPDRSAAMRKLCAFGVAAGSALGAGSTANEGEATS